MLRRPEMVGDTLYGAPRDGRTVAGSPRPAVALTDVSEVAVRRVSVVRTTALALGTLALAAFAALNYLYSLRAD